MIVIMITSLIKSKHALADNYYYYLTISRRHCRALNTAIIMITSVKRYGNTKKKWTSVVKLAANENESTA